MYLSLACIFSRVRSVRFTETARARVRALLVNSRSADHSQALAADCVSCFL